MQWTVILLFVSCTTVSSEFYDTFFGIEINRTRYEDLNRLGLVPFCAIEVAPCDAAEPRRMDGSCNNLQYPPRGATLTPYRRVLPPRFSAGGGLRTSASGKPLPLARPLRVALKSDGRLPSDTYTHMLANYKVFITGDITSVHDTVNYVLLTRTCCDPGGNEDPRCMPIRVSQPNEISYKSRALEFLVAQHYMLTFIPSSYKSGVFHSRVRNDDIHLRRSNIRCLNLTRAITYQRLGCISDEIPPERVNAATPLLDLSVVYGQDANSARRVRSFDRGQLRADLLNGKEWPPTGGRVCINNVPPEDRCHDAAMSGANAVIGINIIYIWMYRSHNAISRALNEVNPCWSDDQLYYTAKEINIAYAVHIMYYEMMTDILGWDFLLRSKVVFPTQGHVNDYDPSLEPRVSIEYVAGTRWFHTIQEGRLKLYTKDGHQYDELSFVDFNLRTGALPLNNTIEGVTQGSFRSPGGSGAVVDPEIGERILGRLQVASDVVSSDIMKGRDVGLAPYNEYRKFCGLTEAKSFKDLLGWMDKAQVEALASFYEHPDDIDLMAGLLAERAMPDVAIGPTLGCIMAEQMLYWRRADRFWYERKRVGGFNEEQLLEIRKMTLAKLLCQHGDGVDSVQPYAFRLPGNGNEITKCSEYEMPNLNVFRDDKCYPTTSPSYEHNSETLPYISQDFDTNQDYEKQLSDIKVYTNIDSLTNQEYPINPTTNERYPTVPVPMFKPNQNYLSNAPFNRQPNFTPETANDMYPNKNSNPTMSRDSPGLPIQGLFRPYVQQSKDHFVRHPVNLENQRVFYSNADPFQAFLIK